MHERQKRFVQEYITNGHNAYRAALDAGYTKNTAIACSAKMPTNPTVKPLLDKAMAVADRVLELDLGITIKTKGQWLLQLIEDVLDPNDPKRDYYKDAIKAIQELNKMQGHHMPTRSVSVTLDATKEKLLEVQRQYKEF